MSEAPQVVIDQLAPTGTLRAGINMGNFLLVTGKTASGDPDGVSPDMAAEVARRLGVPLSLVPYDSPEQVVAAAGRNEWDIGNVGAEPQRMEKMAFTAAYVEIEATYLVHGDSPFKSADELDREGATIIVRGETAYGLYLSREIKNAVLITTDTSEEALQRFLDEKLDAFAGLKSGLANEAEKHPGTRIVDGKFAEVQQAIGVSKQNAGAIAYLRDFVEEAKASGFVANLIEKHGVTGRLSVAPPA